MLNITTANSWDYDGSLTSHQRDETGDEIVNNEQN